MDLLLILGGILWVVLSAVNKKKQQEKKQAERESAAMGRAAQSAQPAPAASASPVFKAAPAKTSARPFNPYAPEPEPAPAARQTAPVIRQAAQAATPRPAPLVSNMQPQSMEGPTERTKVSLKHNLTQIQTTQRHQLTSSYDTGHAHEETSMSGFEENCPPEIGSEAASGKAATAPSAAFSWNQNAVLSGLIYSEILGKPKALRGR